MATGSGTLIGAGIQKYYKPVPLQSSASSSKMPDPNGPLSKKVPSIAIELANSKVSELMDKPRGSPRSPYLILTPAQRFEVGKQAVEHRVTASIQYFAKKYPQLPLKETTVRRLKDLYQSSLKSKRPCDSLENTTDVQELPRKKTGRPLLIGEKLDHQVQEYIRDARKCGLPILTLQL